MRWKSNQIQYFRNLTGCVPGAKRGGEERAGGEKSPSPLSSIPSRFSFVYFPFRNLGEQAQWPEIRRYFIYLFLLLLCFFGSRGKKKENRLHWERERAWSQASTVAAEHSPPTNVVHVVPCVNWVCYWFVPLLREVFFLSSKINISKFQFDLERTDTFKRFLKNS